MKKYNEKYNEKYNGFTWKYCYLHLNNFIWKQKVKLLLKQ